MCYPYLSGRKALLSEQRFSKVIEKSAHVYILETMFVQFQFLVLSFVMLAQC